METVLPVKIKHRCSERGYANVSIAGCSGRAGAGRGARRDRKWRRFPPRSKGDSARLLRARPSALFTSPGVTRCRCCWHWRQRQGPVTPPAAAWDARPTAGWGPLAEGGNETEAPHGSKPQAAPPTVSRHSDVRDGTSLRAGGAPWLPVLTSFS